MNTVVVIFSNNTAIKLEMLKMCCLMFKHFCSINIEDHRNLLILSDALTVFHVFVFSR